jgi:glycosyltransferase involved in cell wall biosynthesis
MKVSLIMPSFERPQRTQRAIESIINQNFECFEAYVAGDNCPVIQELIDSGKAAEYIDIAKNKNIKLSIFNMPYHYGGFGYQARNTCFRLSYGKYVIFMDNDDVIEPDHVKNYYEAICDTENDFMYFDTYIEPLKQVRVSKLEKGMIGHAEIIVTKSLLLSVQPEHNQYEHDWTLIQSMVDTGAKFEKGNIKPTYKIMGLGELRENID